MAIVIFDLLMFFTVLSLVTYRGNHQIGRILLELWPCLSLIQPLVL
jgi:hypothetical protein